MIDDTDRIMQIMGRAFDPNWGEAWNRRQISDSLVLPTIFYQLINAKGAVPKSDEAGAGFVLTRSAPEEEELLLIAVDPEFRGCGLGGTLLGRFAADAKIRGAKRLFLEMRANNPAEHLYTSFGFKPIGRRKDYYRTAQGSRIDAITFGMDV